MRYLVTGGGTGGHIYPALSIIEEIKKRDKDYKILYVGTEKGLEAELVPKEGIDFKTVRVKGLPRKINLEAIKTFIQLLKGLRDSKKIIKEFKPDIIIGTGGYVSFPLVYKGAKMKVPTLIHEQNAYPGISNRILSRYVDRICTTFEKAGEKFKHKDRVLITGNPIRMNKKSRTREEVLSELAIEDRGRLIVSFGGSGGQKKLNDSIREIIGDLQNEELSFLHITGKRLYDDFTKDLKEDDLSDNVKVIDYLYNMIEVLSYTDLVITSAGAITLAEISALGIPSILVPKSYTTENHQEANARVFQDKGASRLIYEKDISGDLLLKTIKELIYDEEILKKMSENTLKLSDTQAASKIYQEIEKLI